ETNKKKLRGRPPGFSPFR
nr:kinin [Polistes sp.]